MTTAAVTGSSPTTAAAAPGADAAGVGDFDGTTARITVDLPALGANWRELAGRVGPATTTAAVVKGDGYGIGLAEAATTLADVGCSCFFVATPREGAALRAVLPEATIYVLDGLVADAADYLAARNLCPVLGSQAEIEVWRAARRGGVATAAALHVDTGMNRLGLREDAFHDLCDQTGGLAALGVDLVMSHLACADTPDHPANRDQLDRFAAVRARAPEVKASLANSAGILLGEAYHFDIVRPGIALYGAAPAESRESALGTVVTCQAQVLQVREAEAGETVGYGAAQTLTRASRLAILGAGYADGYLRHAGSSDARPGARVHVGGAMAPLVGRVSMDLMAADVTDIPGVARGDWAELFGPHVPIDEVAGHAGTIGYELLTSLGRRSARRYLR